MKISLTNNPVVQSKIGQETAVESARRTDAEKSSVAKSKVDSSVISSTRSASFDDSRVATAKSSILYDVTVKDSDRLSELKEAIKNGTYHVPTESLVDAIVE
jgi:anti-sigma28 factor (negative regulator of flagellin synthesis)